MHDRTLLRHTISLQPGWEPPDPGRPGWSRRFGRPLDLPPLERVVLVIAAGTIAGRTPLAVTLADVSLNGTALAEFPAASTLAEPSVAPILARDVTDALLARNVLRLAVVADSAAEGAGDRTPRHRPLPVDVARVWLEIHAAPRDRAGVADHP